MSALTLKVAVNLASHAISAGRAISAAPLTIAVLDAGGHLVTLQREDGASLLRPQIAIGKAWGAVGMGESSRSLSERLKERPAFLGALSTMSQGKVVPVPGGVLIMDGNEIVGAVGVSGGTAEEDEACAIEGIKAAGFVAKS